MLLRPLTDLRKVALDPLPGILGRCTAQLLSMRREDFVHTLVVLRSSEKQVAAVRSGHPRRLAPTWSGCHAASNTQTNVRLIGSSVGNPSPYPAKGTQPRKGESYAALTEGTGEAHDLHNNGGPRGTQLRTSGNTRAPS